MSQDPEDIVRISCSGKELMFYAPDAADHIQGVLRRDGRLYEESALIHMLARPLKRGLVIDVGANIGNHTVFFGKLLRRRVIALEPYEKAFHVLARNVELNGLSDKVTLLQKAAGRKSGRGELDRPPKHNWGQARIRATGSGPVEVIRLDELDIQTPVAMIKVDVEGMEADVLKGAWRLLQRKRPVIYVEAQTSSNYAALRRLLRSIDYQMVRRFNHTPTYLFVSCRTKKQTIDALLEKTEALASIEELAIVHRELSHAVSEREPALLKTLQAAIETAHERQSEVIAAQLKAMAEEQARHLLTELQRARGEIGNELSRLEDESRKTLSKQEHVVSALEEFRKELRRISVPPKPQSQVVNSSGGVTLQLPLAKTRLEVWLPGSGVKSKDSGRCLSFSSSGIPELKRAAVPQSGAGTAKDGCPIPLSVDANDRISVIMTTFNSASFLKNAVLSILEQTHTDLELIVVDDASSDNTFEILLELSRTDPRVRPFKMFKNRGTYWCKNFGITRSTGRYITFQDSDDVADPDRLRLQLRELKLARAVMCTCNYVRIDSSGQIVLNRGLQQRKALISALCDKAEVLRRAGYFDVVRTSADDEFTRRIAIVFGHERMCHVDEPLYRAIIRDGSLTTNQSTKSDISAADSPASAQSFLSAPRREYVRQYSAWHERIKKGDEDPRIQFPQLRRRFPAPAGLLPELRHEDCYITASMASFPARRTSLEQTIASILPQLDFLNVYLNGYDETPEFLGSPKIQVIHSREYGDLRDSGKFFFIDSVPWGYHFTIDDDILYPRDYVQNLILKIEQYDRRAIVGCHGVILANPLVRFMEGRTVFHFKRALQQDTVVNLLGTGTVAYHTSTIKLSVNDFQQPGMADLWLAIAAKRQKIPMLAVERPEQWLKPLAEADETSLYSITLRNDEFQTRIIQEQGAWPIDDLNTFLSAVNARLHDADKATVSANITSANDSH